MTRWDPPENWAWYWLDVYRGLYKAMDDEELEESEDDDYEDDCSSEGDRIDVDMDHRHD